MNREDLAKLYEKANGWSPAAFQITMDELERFAALVAAAEREACAKVCENMERNGDWITKVEAAAAIRARGNQ